MGKDLTRKLLVSHSTRDVHWVFAQPTNHVESSNTDTLQVPPQKNKQKRPTSVSTENEGGQMAAKEPDINGSTKKRVPTTSAVATKKIQRKLTWGKGAVGKGEV